MIGIDADFLVAQLHATLNAVPAYAWYAAPSGRLTFVNGRYADYLGLPRDHPLRFGAGADVARGSQIPLHPDDQEETWRVGSECLRTSRPGEVSVRVRDARGGHRWFLRRTEPLRWDDGTLIYWVGVDVNIEEIKQSEFCLAQGLVGTAIDVSEQEALAKALRTCEEELRQVLDLVPQIVGVLGPKHERLYANLLALEYYGVSLDEWRQRSFAPEVHPNDFDRVKTLAGRSVGNPVAYETEMRLRKGDGSYHWFLVRYNPLLDDQGQLIRWHFACTDIDDRRRAGDRLQQENVALREEVDKASMFEEIVGSSPALLAVLSRVSKVAGGDSTVLITGDTGTGKELVARAIHRRSPRASRAFVAVNCAAIPRDLIASELFGHEKGAFTGAVQRRLGRFELADGGTIFLDEVGELSSETQVALLRVLQDREFERVGGRERINVDVRVIAATNRDLSADAADGTFRPDLFYRLNVFPLAMPPLRERPEDIPVLVEYFIGRYARKAGKAFRRVSKRTLDLLQSYPWPGNVRELQNVIERSVIVSDADEFTVDESWLSGASAAENRVGLLGALAAHEKALVEEALRTSGGRVAGPSGAAGRLGIPRSTLESKIRSLRINKSRFRARTAKRF